MPKTTKKRKSRATGNPPGRPPKFTDPEEMQSLINAYFIKCDKGIEKEYFDKRSKKVVKIKESIPYTMEKLALAIGFKDVKQMWEYIKRPGFTELLTRAKTHIIGTYNENVMLGTYPSNFAPFYLCNIDKENYKPINNAAINVAVGISVEQEKQLHQANRRIPKQVGPSVKQLNSGHKNGS